MTSYELIRTYAYKNKEIKVILEFPLKSDEAAVREFISRLKEIYLEKIKKEFTKEKDFASPYSPADEKEGAGNG